MPFFKFSGFNSETMRFEGKHLALRLSYVVRFFELFLSMFHLSSYLTQLSLFPFLYSFNLIFIFTCLSLFPLSYPHTLPVHPIFSCFFNIFSIFFIMRLNFSWLIHEAFYDGNIHKTWTKSISGGVICVILKRQFPPNSFIQ